MKLFFSVAANERFKLRSINIRAAFLQAKELERDIYDASKRRKKGRYNLED